MDSIGKVKVTLEDSLREELNMKNKKIKDLEENLSDVVDVKNQEIKNLEDSVTFHLNENTQLKNKIKVDKGKQSADIDTQTTNYFWKCENCTENEKLITELCEHLEVIEQNIDSRSSCTYQAVRQKVIDDLMIIMDTIEKDTSNQQAKHKPNEMESLTSVSNSIHPSGSAYVPSKADTSLHQVNRFQPLQHVNNHLVSQEPLSSVPIRPGPHLYSDMVKSTPTAMIITDSMGGGIKMNNIKRNMRMKERGALIKRFPGHTAEEMSYYAPKPLSDSKPDQVIIIAGTNDLTRCMYEKGTVDQYKVVDSILSIGRAARDHGSKKIHISSIMARRGGNYSRIVEEVNELLYMACIVEDFGFINHDDIKSGHISSDGVHLNSHGTSILMFNIFSVFNNFDRNFMDFKEEYQYAMSLC